VHFSLRYLTEYRYAEPVTDNLNALRVRPATTSTQRCDDFHVRVEPEARVQRHADYFGTEVLEFGVAKPHDHLTVDVRARVTTSEPDPAPDAPWEALGSPHYADVAGEFLLPAPGEPEDPRVDELTRQVRATTPLRTLQLLDELVPDLFAYRPGVTYVGTSVDEFLAAGAGVCQDFVHLGLVLLRRNGIAARYVSGYLWSAPQDGGTDSVEVQTHAWLEALLPSSAGRGEPVWGGGGKKKRKRGGGSRSGLTPTRRTAAWRGRPT
jgi:transglutaminase-like putative cysteine protease